MYNSIYLFSLTSLILTGAIFGFFYAWVCSTMWGLDQATPSIAIKAMQAMNASVRNAVFAPAFFGTPLVLLVTAALCLVSGQRKPASLFGLAALVYFCFGLLLTMMVNVPMNRALALVTVPDDAQAARDVWQAYSSEWQFWNQTRTIASGIALLFCGFGLLSLDSDRK